MNFYLCGFIGTGTHNDPYRPSAANLPRGWSIIDLRPPGGGPDGHCLLGTNGTPTATGGGICYQLGANIRDGVGPLLRAFVANRLNLTLDDAADVRDIIRAILLNGREDGSRWRPLRPSGNRFELILGNELVDSWPYVAGGAVASDPFNRANGNIGGSNGWVAVQDDLAISSNVAQPATLSVLGVTRYDTDLGSADHWVGLTVIKLLKNGSAYNYAGVRMRMANPGTTDNGFAYEAGWAAGITEEQNLQRWDSGTATVLATSAVPMPMAGNFDLNGQAQGSSIAGWISGYQACAATDTNYPSYQMAGMHLYTESAVGDVLVDNWRAGTMYEGQPQGVSASLNRRGI